MTKISSIPAMCEVLGEEHINELVRRILSEGEYVVEFKKSDGSHRTMKCTLDTMLVPKDKTPRARKTKSSSIVNVWDTEKQDWRSFNLKNVKLLYEHIPS